MMNHNTVIGELCESYERTFLCTVAELREALHDEHCHYTAKQYCDFRYSTNLERFVYDPFTGEKIDWKRVKELIDLKSATIIQYTIKGRFMSR